ncbi:MAG: hypothetical protein EXR73_00415 [Myxococcales bacterium]|nr:hypothetical protein [Myxococcales bacterium]
MSVAGGRALVAAIVVAGVGMPLVHCTVGDAAHDDAAHHDAALPSVTRLLERLDSARFDLPESGAFFGTLGEAAPDDLLLADEMATDVPFPGRWHSKSFVEAALEGGADAIVLRKRSQRPLHDGTRDSVAIQAGDFLMTTAPVDADTSFLLSARVARLAPMPPPTPTTDGTPPIEPVPPSLDYVPLDHVPPEGDDFVRDLHDHAGEFTRKPRATRLAAGAAAGAHATWHELRAVVHPYPGRKALAFAVSGGACGVALDRVELRRLTAAETLALSGDETVEIATHPLRRRVELDLETWDCLALPAPGSVEFDVVVPAHGARLEFGVAALATAPSEVRLFGLLIEAGTKCALPMAAATPLTSDRPGERRWQLQSIALAAYAGRHVTLRFGALGPRGSVVLLGAPTLLSEPSPAPTPTAATPPNVIVVSLDTLRADHVGCYGGTQVATPALDALAARGTRFARVFSPASYTLPTHLSMLSGQDPLVHETVASTDPMDPLRTLPLAARLRELGWRTAAFTAGGLVHPRYGFGVGFDRYSIRDPGGIVGLHRRIGDAQDDDAQPGEDRMGEVIDWITASRDAPFFLFLHTYLVHNYRPHPPWLDRVGGGPRPTREELTAIRGAAAAGDAAAIARLRALYVASLAQADAEIVARLVAALESLELTENTLVVLVADHGEEFFEHRMIGHGDELWHTLTQVPWIMAGPGVPSGEVRETPVVLADVAPTIAGRLGLGFDPRVLAIDQFSAEATGASNAADDEPVVLSLRRIANRPDQDALVRWPWKLVRRRIDERPWPVALYRLDEDPQESRDRSADEPARTAGMQRQLDARLAEFERQKSSLAQQESRAQFELSPELARMLDQLGYPQGAAEHD